MRVSSSAVLALSFVCFQVSAARAEPDHPEVLASLKRAAAELSRAMPVTGGLPAEVRSAPKDIAAMWEARLAELGPNPNIISGHEGGRAISAFSTDPSRRVRSIDLYVTGLGQGSTPHVLFDVKIERNITIESHRFHGAALGVERVSLTRGAYVAGAWVERGQGFRPLIGEQEWLLEENNSRSPGVAYATDRGVTRSYLLRGGKPVEITQKLRTAFIKQRVAPRVVRGVQSTAQARRAAQIRAHAGRR